MRPDPGAFHAADIAIWDGKQTLPGIWVSHPMAQTARRVRVTNVETGARIDAAMFRRDPNLSGPRVVISSEAAARLGLASGHGTPITIEGLAYRVDTEAEPESAVADAAREPIPAPADVPAADVPAEETAAAPVEPDAAPAAPVPAPPVAPEPAAAGAARLERAGSTPERTPLVAGIPMPRPKPGPGGPAPAPNGARG
jgi:hypothetical protein